MLYELTLLQEKGILSGDIPIYFDSPMGVKTTRVYRKYSSLLSSEVQDRILRNLDPFSPRGLKEVITPQESKKINDVSFAIVLAGSGMANGGRIVHHLKHNLWNPRSHLIFVGYQAEGTLGRRIIDGASLSKLQVKKAVKCKAHTIGASLMADKMTFLPGLRTLKQTRYFSSPMAKKGLKLFRAKN